MNGPAKPRSCLARAQRKSIDVEAEKRAGWRAHGIPVVAEDDARLSWPERALVRQLGVKLYGPRRRKGARHG